MLVGWAQESPCPLANSLGPGFGLPFSTRMVPDPNGLFLTTVGKTYQGLQLKPKSAKSD